eukprot:COSAG01_NODE_6477_length_3644_cov_2.487165_2_plen_93_part_00
MELCDQALSRSLQHVRACHNNPDLWDKAKPPPTWVVAHQATLRCVLAYFLGTHACVDMPHLAIPLHTVFKLQVTCDALTGAIFDAQLQQFSV